MTDLERPNRLRKQASLLWQADYWALHRRICAGRQRKGWETQEAADFIGVSAKQYEDFEAGLGELPAPQLFKIANATGIRIIISDGVIADGID